jgi:hypothetical protein
VCDGQGNKRILGSTKAVNVFVHVRGYRQIQRNFKKEPNKKRIGKLKANPNKSARRE